ncbi:hypothetical protein GJAV_G00276770 [Gymnothorax javanicus]|nr:hypothetical protein GJAV_G00276770 [Gymnothorax javanicus]
MYAGDCIHACTVIFACITSVCLLARASTFMRVCACVCKCVSVCVCVCVCKCVCVIISSKKKFLQSCKMWWDGLHYVSGLNWAVVPGCSTFCMIFLINNYTPQSVIPQPPECFFTLIHQGCFLIF